MTTDSNWFFWAIFSAIFAALTAIFAKVGLDGVDSDLATLVRTVIILAVLSGFVYFTGKWSNPFALSPKTLLFLMLSGLATGASWVCYFRALKIGEASKVAPVDFVMDIRPISAMKLFIPLTVLLTALILAGCKKDASTDATSPSANSKPTQPLLPTG